MVKQVILVNTALNMRKGKLAAQVAHASLKVFLDRRQTMQDGALLVVPLDAEMQQWVTGSFTKIVLGVENDEDLVRAHIEAQARGLPTALVVDNGLTEFHGVPTRTTVAIGPAEDVRIDEITGRGGLIPTKLL